MTNDSVHPAIRRIDSLEEVDALPDGTLIWYWDGTRIHALMRKRDGDSASRPGGDAA